ncbi:MAG TPA: hypothetical protein EYP60_02360 [bacterium (Candidatus Stahlbacteria)]|nr:hypothetical protein [Candidatus Stahlbacteria bacterium]
MKIVRTKIYVCFFLAFLFTSLGYAENWPMFRKNLMNQGYTSEELSPPLFFKWKYRAKDEKEEWSPTLSVAGKFVYISARNLSVVNYKTGKLNWKYFCGNRWYDTFTRSPTIVGNSLYVPAFNGNIYCFDTREDSIKWIFKTGSEIASAVLYHHGKLLFGAPEGVYALKAEDGSLIWQNNRIGGLIYSSPAIADSLVLFGATDGYVYALNLYNGKMVWKYQTNYKIDNAPAIVDKTVYVCSDKVYALDIETGKLLWEQDLGTIVNTSPALAHEMVYVGCDDGHIYALNQRTGKIEWKHKTGDIVTSSPTVAKNILWVGSRDKNLYAIDALSGDSLWSYNIGAFVNGSPVVANGFLYVGADDGYVYAFSSKQDKYRVEWLKHEILDEVKADEVDTIKLTIKNSGKRSWKAKEIYLNCVWINKWKLTEESKNLPINTNVATDESTKVNVALKSPHTPGDYTLRISLTRKGKHLFVSAPLEVKIKVKPQKIENEPFSSSFLPTSYYGFKKTLELLKNERKVVMLVESKYKDKLKNELNQYKRDVESNFDVNLFIKYGDWEFPQEVRSLLQELYSKDSICGAILVGDLPVPMWKAHWGEKYLISLYYEDLEGSFIDSTHDGFFDTHIWKGSKEPQIWISWIRPPKDKLSNLKRFFNKCHSYYIGKLLPPGKALVYCAHNDYGLAATIVGKILGSLYGGNNVETVGTRYLYGCGEDLLELLRGSYEILDVWSHAAPLFHQFSEPPQRNLYSWRIRELPQGALMTFIWGCHAGDFVEAENHYTLPDAYIFGNSIGLACVAATRSIGTDGHDLIYAAFSKGADLGTAFLAYKREMCIGQTMHKMWTKEKVEKMVWGISLFGNPFLSVHKAKGKGKVTKVYWDRPVSGAEVSFLTQDSEKPILSLKTVEDGSFSYNLNPGTYIVKAIAADCTTKTIITVYDNILPGISLVLPDRVSHMIEKGVNVVSIPIYSKYPRADSILPVDSLSLGTWSKDKYVYYPDKKLQRIELGKGYILKLEKPLNLVVEGINIRDMPYTVYLDNGWNLIGNPFNFEVDWNKVEVEWMAWGRPPSRCNLVEAQINRWIKPTLWEFVNGAYKMTDRLVPWHGYWLKAYALSYYAYGHPNIRIFPDIISEKNESIFPLKSYKWYIHLTSNIGNMTDSDNYLAVAKDATDGFDYFDVEKPPVPDTGIPFVYLFFPHTDWGSESGNYAVDVRAPLRVHKKSWEFIIKADKSQATCELNWQIISIPHQYRVTLLDVDANVKLNMRQENSYMFKFSDKANHYRARKFKVIVENRA